MNDKLNILWTTDNKETVFNMLSMYAINSINKGWWNQVNIILWGASVKLVASDTQVQTEVMEMIQAGVSIEACQHCCEMIISNKAIEAATYLYLLRKMVAMQAIAMAKRIHAAPMLISSVTPVTIAPIAITANSIFNTILKTSLIILFISIQL